MADGDRSLHPSERGLVKILVPSEDQSSFDETVWAAPLGEDRFELRNIPFVTHLNVGDVVRCDPPATDDDFPRVVEDIELRPFAKLAIKIPPEHYADLRELVERLIGESDAAQPFRPGMFLFSVAVEEYDRWVAELEPLEASGRLTFATYPRVLEDDDESNA